MKVSFIFPLFNCLALTQEALASLRRTLPAGLDYEILFVDDGSTDGTRTWLASLTAPCRVVLNEKNLGFAGACNRGAAAATGEHLFFLNNDLVFLPRWFEPMSTLLAAPDAGLVGNLQLNHRTDALDHAGIFFDPKGKPAHETAIPLLARLRGWRDVPALTGACLALRRDVWLRLGGFDEGFKNGGEDVDLALRARMIGLRNRVSVRSTVRHHISASLGRKQRDEENSRRLALRWGPQVATHAAPAWARAHLASLSENSFVFDAALLRSALWTALTGRSTLQIRHRVEANLRIEQQRWAHLLDGQPPPSVGTPRYPVPL